MEKYQFDGRSDAGKDYQRWLRLKHKIEGRESCYGSLSLDKSNTEADGEVFVIRIPWMSQESFDLIVQPSFKPNNTLHTLAKKVCKRLWDDGACEGFEELIEEIDGRLKKLEQK